MKIRKGAISFVGALALASGALAADAPTPVVLSETTFQEQSVPPWGYGYFYNNNVEGVPQGTQRHHTSFFTEQEPNNGVWAYNFNLEGLEPANNWGTGTGGPLISTPEGTTGSFVSPERDDYTFSFKARAEGLAEGQTSANAEMQVQFYSGESKKLQVNLGFNPTAQWQTFTFNLSDGALGDNTTDAGFAASHLEVNGVRFNVNFHMPAPQFGYDTNNVLFLDDAKLQVAYTPPTGNPPPSFARTIINWDLDQTPLWHEYDYNWSENANRPVVNGSANVNGTTPNNFGVEGSSGWALLFVDSDMAFTTPAWAGGGTGGGGPADYSHFTSSDLNHYRVSFSARVSGLNTENARETANGVLQLHVEAPDDTLQPADANATADFLARLDFPITGLTTEWQRYSFTFNQSGVSAGQGSKANVQNYASLINTIRTQWQIENMQDWNTWNHGDDNGLYVDNILIERIYVGLGAISFAQEGNELVLSWTAPANGTTKLQAASTVDGVYQDVTTTGTTYRTAMTGAQRFFRLAWVE